MISSRRHPTWQLLQNQFIHSERPRTELNGFALDSMYMHMYMHMYSTRVELEGRARRRNSRWFQHSAQDDERVDYADRALNKAYDIRQDQTRRR